MIPTEHIDDQQQENQQAPSPVVEKHSPKVVENMRAWLNPRKRTLGVALPFLGGVFWVWCMMSLDLGIWALFALLIIAVLAGWCVMLLNPFRRPIATVSLSFAFGELLAFFVQAGFFDTWQAYSVVATFSVFVPVGVVVGYIVALVGASIVYSATR